MKRRLATPFGSVAALDYRPVANTDPRAISDYNYERWAAVLAEICVAGDWDGESIKPGWYPWSVRTRSGEVYPSLDLSGGVTFPEPVYPQLGDRTTRPGTCSRGWIVFDTLQNAKLAEVAYDGQDLDEPAVWALR
jgi:hypothetical protein